jgi:hypothetical protein
MSIHDPDWVPSGADPEDWLAIPHGARLRMLHAGLLDLHLSRDEMLEAAALPLWMCYGPENGLPEDWFNPSGFLLPKYRPGGGSYDQFREWRRDFRRRRWLAHLRNRGLWIRYRKLRGLDSILLLVLFAIAVLRIHPWLVQRYGGLLGNALFAGAYILSVFIGVVALAVVKVRFPWLDQ